MNPNYSSACLEILIIPKMRELEKGIQVNVYNTSLFDLSVAIENHRNTQHQWISAKDDEICDELCLLIQEASLLPHPVPQEGRRKLYYDLMRLKDALEEISKTPNSKEINYFIGEMLKCTPHTATHYEYLLKTNHIMVYYNRLRWLSRRLVKEDFDCKDEHAVKNAILDAYFPVEVIGHVEPVKIPNDKEEFMIQWRLKAFDNQIPETLYPPQNMYRNMPYNSRLTDDWIFAHRDQMKYMNGDVYWQRSPAYIQMGESIRFAFHNYPDVMPETKDVDELPQISSPNKWSLENVCYMPKSHIPPTNAFKTYYNEIVADFCKCIEESNDKRTDHHMSNIYTQASRIRVMSEWMLRGIDNVEVPGFIMLAWLEPVPVVHIDLSHSPVMIYRRLINYLAYATFADCDKEEKMRVIGTIKSLNNMVN